MLIMENIFQVSHSNTKLKGSTHVLFSKGRGKNLDMFLLRKGNFIMINELRYGQTWKVWPSPFSLSLYSTFKTCTFCILYIWCSLKWKKWRKSSIKNKNTVDSLNIWCRNCLIWINKTTLPLFSICTGSNCWLQYWF